MRASSMLRIPFSISMRALRKCSRVFLRPDVIHQRLDLRRRRRRRRSSLAHAARMLSGALLFVHCQPSFISTVNILFCNEARVGVSAAMEVGSPMWRRSVPISTTSSSPFLNSPISPFTANGSRSRTS